MVIIPTFHTGGQGSISRAVLILLFSPICPSLFTDKINLFLVLFTNQMSKGIFCLTDWQLLSIGSEYKMQPKVMGQDSKM